MKFLAAAVLFLVVFSGCGTIGDGLAVPLVDPAEAAGRVATGEAVLVDVREPEEWKAGVAGPAHLLSLSDLRGDRTQWNEFLREHKGKEILLYCRSGNRSGIAAEILAKEGIRVGNAGGFSEWQAVGLPERKPDEEKTSIGGSSY